MWTRRPLMPITIKSPIAVRQKLLEIQNNTTAPLPRLTLAGVRIADDHLVLGVVLSGYFGRFGELARVAQQLAGMQYRSGSGGGRGSSSGGRTGRSVRGGGGVQQR